VVFVLVLLWAGAPSRRVQFDRAWQTANQLGVIEVLLIALAVALAAMLLQPLQLGVVRLLEGGFPRWLGADVLRQAHETRLRHLTAAVQSIVDEAAALPRADVRRDRKIQEAGAQSARLRSRYPVGAHLVRPTALGNALAAVEDTAGAAYGLDAVVAWPRLYPLLGDQMRVIVDDLRDGMDSAATLAATGGLTAAVSMALLAPKSGWWTLLAVAPLAIGVVGYLGAVRGAQAYGLAVTTAFDLHRFDLLRAMRLAVPTKLVDEIAANQALCDFWRQGVPGPFSYIDATPSTAANP
jgi:hypothetical protein